MGVWIETCIFAMIALRWVVTPLVGVWIETEERQKQKNV